ncbi:MAG: ABC transporter permease, partial [Blastocatellia bacterium]
PQTERVWAEMVSGNFFDVLGVHAMAGRTFSAAEQADRPGAFPVAVISERLWRNRFQSDPSIIGGTIRLNRQPFTVVGVVPAEFRGTLAGLTLDLWFPIMMQGQVTGDWNWPQEDRTSRPLRLMARLKPGITVDQANAEMQSIAGRLATEYPTTNKNMGAKVLSLADSPDGSQGLLKILLFVLFAAAGVVLLIVCANVGNLLLSRSVSRQKEFGIRLSLGASRGRLVRQLTTETLILAGSGAALGLLAANWLAGTINLLLPPSGLPTDLGSSSTFDGLTFGFTFLLCLASALLCALAPAIQFFRPDWQDWLKDTARGSTAGRRSRNLRSALVAAEMSLALVALVGAGLFLKSFRNSRAADPGFQPNGILLAGVQLGQAGYTADQAFAALVRLQDRVRAVPGVETASIAENVPLGFDAGSWEDLDVQG